MTEIAELEIEDAVRDFLRGENNTITGNSNVIQIYVSNFPPEMTNANAVAILIRKAGGLAPHEELDLYKPWFQVWVRADTKEKAINIMKRVDTLLHRFGPKALNADLFGLSIVRNTGIQRLDDPVTNLVQFFAVYAAIVRAV